MIEVRQTSEFKEWFEGLRDLRAKARVTDRVDRLGDGNPGDSKTVGQGVMEMRINYGPGYRVYYVQRGKVLVILLCGGDKGSQKADIRKAHELAKREG